MVVGDDDWRSCFGVVRGFLLSLSGPREEEAPFVAGGVEEVGLSYLRYWCC